MSEVRSRAGRIIGLVLLTASLGGCSFAIPSLVSEPEETTGSITPAFTSPLFPDLSQEDWRRAKSALGVALDPQGNGASANWDNPQSGLKGTISPAGQPFVQSDEVCRLFKATIVHGRDTRTVQGRACRLAPDEWELHAVTPLRRAA